MKAFLFCLVSFLVFVNGQGEPPFTDEPATDEPVTEAPITEAPVVTEKPKKCHCICQWKKCNRAVQATEAKRECFDSLKTCARKHCDLEMCDGEFDTCKEKEAKHQKNTLKCEKHWKKCYQNNRGKVCHKKHKKADDEFAPPPPPPPGPPGGEEPPTEEPPTEGPPTEAPVTEAPATEKPHKGAKCIGKWKQCMKAADSVDGKRECYAGLKACAQGRPCDTEMCDSMMSGCLESATPKQKESLKCEKQWKKCYIQNRKQMCHKKGAQYDDIEGPLTDFPPVETEEPFPPTEQPTEEPMTEEPVTEKPKPEKFHCLGDHKKCRKEAGSTDEKRTCFDTLRRCAESHCDTSSCDSALSACAEKASAKKKEKMMCEMKWWRCFRKDHFRICH